MASVYRVYTLTFLSSINEVAKYEITITTNIAISVTIKSLVVNVMVGINNPYILDKTKFNPKKIATLTNPLNLLFAKNVALKVMDNIAMITTLNQLRAKNIRTAIIYPKSMLAPSN